MSPGGRIQYQFFFNTAFLTKRFIAFGKTFQQKTAGKNSQIFSNKP
jgi:hypothetical protein